MEKSLEICFTKQWSNQLSEIERFWFTRLCALEWDGFDGCQSPDEVLETLHDAMDEAETALTNVAENYTLASEQIIKLADYDLPAHFIEVIRARLQPQIDQENRLHQDRLYVFEERRYVSDSNRPSKSYAFDVMTRDDFLRRYNISEPTYTDFVASGNELYGVYEMTDLELARQFAFEQYDSEDMTVDDFVSFRNKQNLITVEIVRGTFPDRYFYCLPSDELLKGQDLTLDDVLHQDGPCDPGQLLLLKDDGAIFEMGTRSTIPVELAPDADSKQKAFKLAIKQNYPDQPLIFNYEVDSKTEAVFLVAFDADDEDDECIDRVCIGQVVPHQNVVLLTLNT